MKRVLAVLLVGLLVGAVGIMSAVADEVPPNVQISEEEMDTAKPAGEAITIEMDKPEGESWEKYLYVDVDHNLNEESQTLWTRLGTRKGNFDFSVGWTQKFNELATELMDKGLVSVSMSIWW